MTPGTGVLYIMVYIIKYLLNKYCTFDDQLVKQIQNMFICKSITGMGVITDLTTGFNKDS